MTTHNKQIAIEPSGRMLIFFDRMFSLAPEGYRFVCRKDPLAPLLKSDTIYFTIQKLFLNRLIPMHILKALADSFLLSPPEGVHLTYSIGHLVFRREPWVVQLEWVHQLTGFSYKQLLRFRRLIEKKLASPECKKILCWCDLSKKGLLTHLNCEAFAEKIEVVPYAIPSSKFVKRYDDRRVRLLFLGSANRPGEFFTRGGHVALEAYAALKPRYPNLELVIAASIPESLRARYASLPGLTIVEENLSEDSGLRDAIFGSADIFLFPGHLTSLAILEAMSYELPVVATNVAAVGEIVEDGVTGLLIPPARDVPYFVAPSLPTGPGDGLYAALRRAVERIDPALVRATVESARILIENADLRREIGRRGRREVDHGRFSIAARNQRLRKVFDEAVSCA